MTTVPPIESAIVTPIALSCSIHRPPPTSDARLVLRFALASTLARMPVSSAPSVPPTPWTPKVSSASSYLKIALSLVQARNGTTPAPMPITTAPLAVTRPAAGVITTRPATTPEQNPSTVGLPRVIHSRAGHTVDATAAASVVATNAFDEMPSAATALPALKPYQPTHSMPVPTTVSTRLCGRNARLPKPVRLPRIRHSTSADQPDDMCTTVPPAKSIARIAAPAFHTPFIRPSAPHTMCASGMYTTSIQIATNAITAEYFMRSAIAPTISAGVMIANIIWNIANTLCETHAP